jgi:hypothetical protein
MRIALISVGTFLISLTLAAFPMLTANAQSVSSIIPAYNPQLDVVQAPTTFGTGKVWQVGPTRTNKTFSSISRQLQDGDVVQIDSGTYVCDESAVWYANNITVMGVGGRPVFDASTCSLSGDKGIFNPRGTNMIIANIEFTGAHGASGNGAGIRLDGGGYVYITNSYFHHNQNGVLLTPDPGTVNASIATQGTNIVIDHSEFAYNGACDGPCTHNMYISSISNSFVLRFSYTHNSHVGHTVKSRSMTNYILYNRITDELEGDSSYNIDIPQGGLTYIIGNLIQQGPNSNGNYTMISYAAETPGQPANPIQKLYISNNTIVNEMASGVALNVTDSGLTEAKMINNLIVGIQAGNVVGGSGSGKVVQTNNLVTDSPGFVDRTNRVYALTASSPAINTAVNPGTGGSISLAPLYEFIYPASAKIRPTVGGLDVGGYEYDPTETIPNVPTITLSVSPNPVDFNATAQITWSASDATYCSAGGGWSGGKLSSGTYTTPPITTGTTYSLSCTGPGGSASKSVTVAVKQSPAAIALGTYTWQPIANSSLSSLCAANIKDANGNYVYSDNNGTGPYCESLTNGMGVYHPDTKTWYLIGGGGGRNYYGNETYGFNLATQQPVRVTNPTHINQTTEYTPSDFYGNQLHMLGCHSLVHLSSGATTIAPRSQWAWSVEYNPITKTILSGPGGFNGGAQGCSPTINGATYYGQSLTDAWVFNPLAATTLPTETTKVWSQISDSNYKFTSVSPPVWFFDPVTAIAYVAGNRNYFGGYLVDYSKGTTNPPYVLVNNVYPFGMNFAGYPVVDTTNHYAFIMGSGKVQTWNLNGLSMTKYGTLGTTGTIGIAGGSGPLFQPDTSWTVTGDTTILNTSRAPGITYNPSLKAFVAWAGDDKVYFMYPNYQTKVLDIVSKFDMVGWPTYTGDLNGKFVYIPEKNAYLVFTGFNTPFYYLIPPGGGGTVTPPPPPPTTPPPPPPTPSTAPTVTLTASKTSITTGGTSNLTWGSTNATSCTGTGFTASGITGTVTVSPTVTTTYGITCTGAGGSASANVTVTVSSGTTGGTISIGSRVKTTANLNVRTDAGTRSSKLCVQRRGALGTVTAGPKTANGYTWWQVNFDSRCDGWVVRNYLTTSLAMVIDEDTEIAYTDTPDREAQLAAAIATLEGLLKQIQELMNR